MSMETSIRLKAETRDELKKLGRKGETYDDVIKRLISDHKELEKIKTTRARPNNFNYGGKIK